MDRVLKCKMFGRLSLCYNDQEIYLKCGVTSKVMQLFLLLLYAGDTGIPKEKLLKNLYEQDEIQDVKNALRILTFRLKKLLPEAGFPEGDYIITKKSVCYFGGNFEIRIDAKAFLQAAEVARGVSDEEARIEALKAVCESYSGEFLPHLSTEIWVTTESLRYKDVYTDCVNMVYELLKKRDRYSEMLQLCSRAADIYPFEEWQTLQIDCLIAQDRYKEALKTYEEVTKLYFDELGLSPSEKMLGQFRVMSGKIQHAVGNMINIQGNLKETRRRQGAFYCSYPSFADGYRMFARMIERTGLSVFLMLCTITDNKGLYLDDETAAEEEMDNLCLALEGSLRRGDTYTRYSMNQVLILLVGIRQEQCVVVFNRISGNYKKYSSRHRVGLSYHVASVAEIQQDSDDMEEGMKKTNWT